MLRRFVDVSLENPGYHLQALAQVQPKQMDYICDKLTEHKNQEAFRNSEKIKEKHNHAINIEGKKEKCEQNQNMVNLYIDTHFSLGMQMEKACIIFVVNTKQIMTFLKKVE